MANTTTVRRSDPLRNFKFLVSVKHPDPTINTELGNFGFTSISGLSQNTGMMAYREGGMNTNPHKLPGMTDFAPLNAVSGLFWQKPGMWHVAKQIFSLQQGGGTLDPDSDFRFTMVIRLLDHPVTRGPAAYDFSGAVMAWKVQNAWCGSVSYGDLNAQSEAIMIQSLTINHEGLDVFHGAAAIKAANL